MSEIVERDLAEVVLDDEQVVQYLHRHPDFFVRNADDVEQLQVTHPVREAVSLVEWHLCRQRRRIKLLEEEVTTLMEMASVNQALFGQLLALQGGLALASTLPEFFASLDGWAQSLGLSMAKVLLLSDVWQIETASPFALSRGQFDMLRLRRMAGDEHYLGMLEEAEWQLLMPDAKPNGSVALSLLGERGNLGLLLFVSHDQHHYKTGMGTLLLQHLRCFLPQLLQRWIVRNA